MRAWPQSLAGLPEVDLVQHDALWRKRLDAWLALRRARWCRCWRCCSGLGALLVVGNTVRLDIQARREEIGVLQLLGASDGFIRRPFLYLGAWYGLGAGAVALGADRRGRAGLAPAAGRVVAKVTAARSRCTGLDLLHSSFVLVGTVVLGWLGAWLVTGHFLRQTRPTET